jgi:RNase P subunit RPR2
VATGIVIETGPKKRTCHGCGDPIPAGKKHVRIYSRRGRNITSTNICQRCLDETVEEMEEP